MSVGLWFISNLTSSNDPSLIKFTKLTYSELSGLSVY